MATERVDIVVSETGTRTVKRNLEDIGKSAKNADGLVNGLNKTLAAIGLGIGLKQLIDRFVEVERVAARLDAVLARTGNTTQRTYSQLIQMSNQLELATGRSAQEIQAAMTNLATFGTIGGDVFERAIKLGIDMSEVYGYDLRGSMEAVARSLENPIKGFDMLQKRGFTLDKQQKELIKTLIATGKSAEAQGVILKMLEDQVGGAAQAAYTGLGRSLGQLQSRFTNLIDKLNEVMNLSGTIAAGVDVLSMGFESLEKNASLTAIAIAAIGGAAAMASLVQLYRLLMLMAPLMLKLSVGLAPFVVVGAAIGIAAQQLLNFNKTMDDTVDATGRVVTSTNRLSATWAATNAYVKSVWENFPEWFTSIFKAAVAGAITELSKLGKTIQDSALKDAKQGQDILGFFGLPTPEYAKKAIKELEDTNLIANKIGFELPPGVEEQSKNWGSKAAEAYKNAYTQTLTDLSPLRKSDGANRPNEQIEEAETQHKTYAKILEDLRRQTEGLMMEADARERLTQIYAAQDAIKRKLSPAEASEINRRLVIIQGLTREAEVRDELARPAKAYTDTLKILNDLLIDNKISQDQYNQSLRTAQIAFLETDKTMQGGLLRGVLKLQDEFADLAGTAENALTNAFNSAEDALVNFAATGKTEISDLVNSMLKDFARLAIRQNITGPLLGALGGFLGSSSGGGGGVDLVGSIGASLAGKRAGGGPVAPNSLYRINERGPELLNIGGLQYLMNSNQSGSITPMSSGGGGSGGMGGGVVVLQPVVNNYASDKVSVTTETGQDSQGQPTFTVIVDSIERELSSRVDSGRSPLLSSMGRGLGATVKPRGG